MKLGNMTETEAGAAGGLSGVLRVEMSGLWQDFRGTASFPIENQQGQRPCARDELFGFEELQGGVGSGELGTRQSWEQGRGQT